MQDSPEYVRQLDLSGMRRRSSLWLNLHLDPWLLLSLICLSSFGLTLLYSASDYPISSLKRQLSFMAVGFFAMIVVAQLPMRFYKNSAIYFYLAGIILLLLVPLIGIGAKGAQRWIAVPVIGRFQPSELIKIIMPLTIAWYLSARVLPPRFKYVFVSLALIALPTLLIASQPDLGTSILVASSGVFVLLLSGLSWWYVFSAVALFAASAWPLWHFVLHPYQRGRILTLLDPERDKFGAGWNILQSKTAIGSGGWDGKGFLNGTQSQLNFLPETHTDFIIAVLAEEQGFKGVIILFALYALVIARGLFIAWQAKTTFNKLVASSITLTFFVYVFVNAGMVSGILPVVGVPLPLVSQGGTSIVTLLLAIGILMAIASDKQQFSR